MSTNVSVSFERTYYEKKKQVENIPRAHRYQLEAWGSKVTRRLKARGGGGVLTARTGHLRRNVGMRMSRLGYLDRLTVGTGSGVMLEKVKYADVQDRGGTIRPRRKKYLTIPLGKTKGRAANYDNTFVQKSKAGNLLIFQKKGKGKRAKITPLFLLKKSVKIPASKWFTATIKRSKTDLRRMMSKAEVLRVAKRI